MPEGSDGYVRAEFQTDDEQEDSKESCNQVKLVKSLQNFSGYTSSGGSDSEQDPRDWGRSPRNGHVRSKTLDIHSDLHGCQRGLQSKTRRQQSHSYQKLQERASEQGKKATSLPDKQKIRRRRKRQTSCSYDETKKDSNRVSCILRYLNVDNGTKSNVAKEKSIDNSILISKDNKKLTDFDKDTDNIKREVDSSEKSLEGVKDNKEMYEIDEEKLKENSSVSTTDDKKDTEKSDPVAKLVKVDKDRLNSRASLKMCTAKNTTKLQTDMLEKQKLKKEDAKTCKEMENQFGKMFSNDIRDVEKNSIHDKLIVNMEQGKSRQNFQLDNRDVEIMESRNVETEETKLKAVLDPKAVYEKEKMDKSDKEKPLNGKRDEEKSVDDKNKKEESLGFEVKCESLMETEPESTNLERAELLWYRSKGSAVDRLNSVDETSCSFSEDRCPLSTEWQSSVFYCTTDSKSVADIYTANCQDSNRFEELLEDMKNGMSVCVPEMLKMKIIEYIDQIQGSDNKSKNELVDNMNAEENECKIDEDEKKNEKIDVKLVEGETVDDVDSLVKVENGLEGEKERKFDHEEKEESEISPIEDDTDDQVPDSEKVVITPIEDGTDIEAANNSVEYVIEDVDEPVETKTDFSIDDLMKYMDDGEQNDSETNNYKVSMKIIDAEDKDENEDIAFLEDTEHDKSKVEPNMKELKAGLFIKDANTDLNRDIFLKKGSNCNSDCQTFGEPQKRKAHPYSERKMKSDQTVKRLNQKCPGNSKDDWTKIRRKKIFSVTIPEKEYCIAPKRKWTGRGYSMFGCGNFGRRCSANSGSGKGGEMGGNQSPSSNKNNEDKNMENRRNQGNNDRESEDRNSNNSNNSGQNNEGRSQIDITETESKYQPTRGHVDIRVPVQDYKRYRKKVDVEESKKHTSIEDYEWLAKISYVVKNAQGPTIALISTLSDEEWQCILGQLDMPAELSPEAIHCSICITVESLLKHYAHCLSGYNSCDMCVKIFSLICSHVAKCANDTSGCICERRICNTIKLLSENNIVMRMRTLWFNVRKKLARILDNTEEDVVQEPTPVDEPVSRRPSKILSHSGPLPSIPEGTTLTLASTSRSGSRVLRRKKLSLAHVDEKAQRDAADVDDEPEEVDSKYGLARAEIPDEADAIPTSSEDGSVDSSGSMSAEGSGQFGITTGATRFKSLPMGPPGHGEPYFPSFKDRPTGKKGIGEVVYANVHQLVTVSTIWEKFKMQYLIEAKLAKHYTEEGVILQEFKSKLKIKGLRYQNDFQWVKVTHLGNGMTGKCHLANDFETDFKFCVKEIHISNYEKEEIVLWSELDNPYVVKVYGAIRHGEKIYILQEFIEGGCLTEAINVQRKLGRRLSQLTALRFFHQLLHALRYLKSRNILHEDLKADNILLNKTGNSVSIKLADFGLARRCQGSVRGGTKPVGTQTQWSPEKAEARVGYGFAAEIWAAICVLVHMLSGQPPWIRRYESYKALIIVIVEKSPPMEDIPRNIHECIKDLIKRGFTVCQGQRPTAEQLLDHHAFRLLDEATTLQSVNATYSILESMHSEMQTNQIDFDPNADLREIFRNLNQETEAGAAASVAEKKERASIVNLHTGELPYYSNEYRVYAVKDKQNEERKQSFQQVIKDSSKNLQNPESSKLELGTTVSEMIYTRTRLPSQPDNNIDPSDHIARFYEDIAGPTPLPQQAQLPLLRYDPTINSSESEKRGNGSRESSIDNLSSGTVTGKLIPDFNKIGMTLSFEDSTGNIRINSSSSESSNENHDEFLNEWNDEEALEHVRGNYTLPTVVNTSADQSPGSQFPSLKNTLSLASENRTGKKAAESSIPDNTEKLNPVVIKKQPKQSSVSSGDEHLQSFNDDDLFRSGSPQGLGQILSQQLDLVGNVIQEVPEPSDPFPPHGISPSPSIHLQTNTVRQAPGELSLPAPYRGGHAYNHPNLLPHSAPPNTLPVTVGGLSYMRSTTSYNQPLSAVEPHYNPGSIGLSQHVQMKRYPSSRNPYQPHDGYSLVGQQQIGSRTQQSETGTQSLKPFSQAQSRQQQQFHDNNMYIPNRQNQNFMTRPDQSQTYVQGHQNFGQYSVPYNVPYNVPSTTGKPEQYHYLRSEIQPEDITRMGMYNQPYNRNLHDPISMPNQPRKVNVTPTEPQSLLVSAQVSSSSTPRSVGNMYGARPKQPQVQRQLFPVYGTRNTDVRIKDPRQVCEQMTRGQHGRFGYNTGYPAQPKTPILNPAINPRPPPPQEGQRLDLRLDINRAQNATETQVQNYALTAPVFSPPKTPSKKSPDLHRTMSQIPISNRKSLSQTGLASASSSKEDKMSTSTSKSQFEEQDEAFRELGRTAEEALSQHSDHGPVFMFSQYEDDIDDEITHEIDERYLDNPAESLAHMLDPQPDSSITVTFRSKNNGKEFKMNFLSRHMNLSWEKIIREELDGFSRISMRTEFQLQRFCLRHLDGSIIDLDGVLGNSNLTVLMTEATDNDPWWIEGGMVMK